MTKYIFVTSTVYVYPAAGSSKCKKRPKCRELDYFQTVSECDNLNQVTIDCACMTIITCYYLRGFKIVLFCHLYKILQHIP